MITTYRPHRICLRVALLQQLEILEGVDANVLGKPSITKSVNFFCSVKIISKIICNYGGMQSTLDKSPRRARALCRISAASSMQHCKSKSLKLLCATYNKIKMEYQTSAYLVLKF